MSDISERIGEKNPVSWLGGYVGLAASGWSDSGGLLTKEAGREGLRPHDVRHHAITKLAESPEASGQTIMAIAGHVSREMLEHYSHIRQQAKRKAVKSLDNVTIGEMGGGSELT